MASWERAVASSGSRCTGTPASRARSSIDAAICPRPAATTLGAPSPVYWRAAVTSGSGIQIEWRGARVDLHRGFQTDGLQAGAQTLSATARYRMGTAGG